MELKSSLKEYNKEEIFDRYAKIVNNFKNYDNITRTKMIEEIIKELSIPKNIVDICTERELKVLIKIVKKEEIEHEKYIWEFENLWNKCILIDGTFEISEELKESINNAINMIDWKEVKENDRINELSIGYVKAQGDMVSQALISVMSFLLEIEPEKLIDFYNQNKLFNYYIYRDSMYFESVNQTLPLYVYNDYYEYMEDLAEQRKKYGTSKIGNLNTENFISIFYNDLNINNPKVKKLVDLLKKECPISMILISMIAIDCLLYTDHEKITEIYLTSLSVEEKNREKYIKILNEAMEEIPSGALNGCTPKEYRELVQEEKEFSTKKAKYNETQVNASLHPSNAKLFYKLYFGLLEYTNNKYNVSKTLTKIYKRIGLNPRELNPIIEKLWENGSEIIDSFIKENPYKFDKYELSLVEDFKKGIRKKFVIARYEQEYTLFIDEEKTYMVKGINDNIDNIIAASSLPTFVETTLLPFKGNIIYDGIFSGYNVTIGSGISKQIEEEVKNNIKYYHL